MRASLTGPEWLIDFERLIARGSASHPHYLNEAQRQAVVLALAILALERPGWDQMLHETAGCLDGHELYDRFKSFNADQWPKETVKRAPK